MKTLVREDGIRAMREFFLVSREVKKIPRKGVIVFVDDDPAAIEYITELLGEKASLVSFHTLKEAKDGILQIGFDEILSIVLDYYLPDGTGVELAEWLDEQHPGIPMFLVSSDDDRVMEFAKMSPNLTPVKKWDVEELEEALGI